MKRWNQAGTVHAKVRMQELRDRKRNLLKFSLISEMERVTRCERGGWWKAAQAAGLRPGCGVEASIAFLRSAIAGAKP